MLPQDVQGQAKASFCFPVKVLKYFPRNFTCLNDIKPLGSQDIVINLEIPSGHLYQEVFIFSILHLDAATAKPLCISSDVVETSKSETEWTETFRNRDRRRAMTSAI